MKEWSVRRYEMETCCRMQIESLLELLYECRRSNNGSAISVTPRYLAAPHDDSLFDSLRLYIKTIDGGKLELSGTVYYWNPVDGSREEKAVIRIFDSLDSCIAWLESGTDAIEKCADALI